MKLARNKVYQVPDILCPHALFASSGTATIVGHDQSEVFLKILLPTGTLNSKTRKIQLTVNADANGKITAKRMDGSRTLTQLHFASKASLAF